MKPSPSADGTKSAEADLSVVGLRVDGVDVNQLNVVIGISVVVVVVVVVVVEGVAVVVVVMNESSIRADRSSMLSDSSGSNPIGSPNWLICSNCLLSSWRVFNS